MPLRSLPVANDLDDEELMWRAAQVPLRPRRPTHVRRGGRGRRRSESESEGGEGEGSAWGEMAGGGDRKLALLFVDAGDLPFASLWAQWLRGHERLFSLYVDGDEQVVRQAERRSGADRRAGGRVGRRAALPAVFRGRFVSSKVRGGGAWEDV